MVSGERHRVAPVVGDRLWGRRSIEGDRDVGRRVAVLAARNVAGLVRRRRAVTLPPTKGYFVNRLWSRVGVRASSVGLLAVGVAGGLYLGHGKEVQPQQRSAEAQLVVQSDLYETQLLKQRQSYHAAARAWQRQAESDAAEKAAAAAKAAASKARAVEKKAIAKKAAEERATAPVAKKKPAESGRTVTYTGPIPASCGDYSGNRAVGCSLMLKAGFDIGQFPCLDRLWTKESHWNTRASNPGSGAYGIPQALPGSKMGAYGGDWRTNPATQIRWGLNYIEGRYDTPCKAWSHSQSTGWY